MLEENFSKIETKSNTKNNNNNNNNAANDFEINVFRLMINSVVYGKQWKIKNLLKRISVTIVNNEQYFLKYVSKPNFISLKIFSKNFTAIHEIQSVLWQIYGGLTVVELSKWLLFVFNVELLFNCCKLSSLTYEIKSGDIYEDLYKYNYLSDWSNYLNVSKFFDPSYWQNER